MGWRKVTVSEVGGSGADDGKSLELAEGGLFLAFLEAKSTLKQINTGLSSYSFK